MLAPLFCLAGSHRAVIRVALGPILLLGTLACNELSGLAGTQSLPSGTANPSSFNTPAGALAQYNNVLFTFQYTVGDTTTTVDNTTSATNIGVFVDYVLTSGLFSDELRAGDLIQVTSATTTPTAVNSVDSRQLPGLASDGVGCGIGQVYVCLMRMRGLANEAIGDLAAYDAHASPALRGQLYALQGYAEIMLADLYCSGIPLSTLDFKGNYTYQPGSTTSQVYQDAIAKFDLAITLSGDSARILNLARVGKGRAYLDLGQSDSAADAVASVPDGYAYTFLVDWSGGNQFGEIYDAGSVGSEAGYSVADMKGGNGLPFLTSDDPRSQSAIFETDPNTSLNNYAPDSTGGATPGIFNITVANWIEARLIRAEAALQAGDIAGWLTQLNYLRQNAITPALPSLIDPGTPAARVTLLFNERAYWLFLTGHRQGDLRRLVRQYDRDPATVYPTGAYPLGSALPTYSGAVTAPIPSAERANPLFTGCLSQGA